LVFSAIFSIQDAMFRYPLKACLIQNKNFTPSGNVILAEKYLMTTFFQSIKNDAHPLIAISTFFIF